MDTRGHSHGPPMAPVPALWGQKCPVASAPGKAAEALLSLFVSPEVPRVPTQGNVPDTGRTSDRARGAQASPVGPLATVWLEGGP